MVARSTAKCYDFSEFIACCFDASKVKATKSTRDDAKQHFNLQTETQLLDFLAHCDFEDLQHDNTEKLDKGPDVGTFFDAYIFRLHKKYIYLAFYQRPNSLWIIKSFHPPEVGDKAPALSFNPFNVLKGSIK